MSGTTRLVTAEEFERFPEDDYRYELVDGRVVRMSPTGVLHGWLVTQLSSLLIEHLRSNSTGLVLTEVGFRLSSSPDTVRAPDLSFIRRERLKGPSLPRGFWHGPPDVAVEVLSPDDRPADVSVKVAEYLTRSVSIVVVIDPDELTVTVHRQSNPPAILRGADILDLNPVIPGFRCSVRDIFGRHAEADVV
jgi:Uma2 family endonuclease